MRNDLEHDICPKCGEWHDDTGKGIWWQLSNPCAGHTQEYRMLTGRAGMALIKEALSMLGYEETRYTFAGLLEFEHFKAMPNYKEATWLERNCYSLARDMEVKQMKRMKAYLQLEEDLMYKY